MRLSKDFARFFVIPIVLLGGIGLTILFMFFYTSTIRMPDGTITSGNWPKEFTMDFSQYIDITGDTPDIEYQGKEKITKNGLWVQILNEDGTEMINCEKPEQIPCSYHPYELLLMYQYGSGEYSVFMSSIAKNDKTYIYLIGFPTAISKVVMYVDTARYHSGKILIIASVLLTIVLMVVLAVFYNGMIVRNLERIKTVLHEIAARTYHAEGKRTFLREIYDGLDILNQEIEASDQQRKRDEKAKQEWLANITHDLKTPLAPIRGYAELLADPETIITEAEALQYGGIILKNTQYAEQLVNDLKLTYQLQSDMLPLKKEAHDITCFVKEVIIDLLNSLEYEGRDIDFSSECEGVWYEFDSLLLKRAITNLVVNALTHNQEDTKICVTLKKAKGLWICVADNGCGMEKQELKGLFTRYYRGTSTEIKPEGSGLGMAIAKQIVIAHGGNILAQSRPKEGTVISIWLPC